MTRAALTSFADIVALLQARPEDVARRYAPGGFVNGQQYRARNPGRADKRIGSFWVNVAGPHVGRFNDASTGEHGDMLDLIQLALGCDRRAALAEARAFLGIADDETEAQRALRQREAQRAREAAEAQAREAEAEKARERRRASPSSSNKSPRLQYSMAMPTRGGSMYTPRKPTMLGWWNAA